MIHIDRDYDKSIWNGMGIHSPCAYNSQPVHVDASECRQMPMRSRFINFFDLNKSCIYEIKIVSLHRLAKSP